MMTGNKWSAFVLDLSFLGWHLLNVCTLGILGVFYVNPYVHQTDAALYQMLKTGRLEEQTEDVINIQDRGSTKYGTIHFMQISLIYTKKQ